MNLLPFAPALTVLTNGGGMRLWRWSTRKELGMFTMLKESRDGEYLQVCENYRDQGRVRQRLILYVGPYASIDEALERLPEDDDKADRLRELVEANPDLVARDRARAARHALTAEARVECRERKREARKKAKRLLKGHGSLEEVFRAYDAASTDANHRAFGFDDTEEEKAAARAEQDEIEARAIALYDSLSAEDKEVVHGLTIGIIAGQLNRRYNQAIADIEEKHPEESAEIQVQIRAYGDYYQVLEERFGLAPHPLHA